MNIKDFDVRNVADPKVMDEYIGSVLENDDVMKRIYAGIPAPLQADVVGNAMVGLSVALLGLLGKTGDGEKIDRDDELVQKALLIAEAISGKFRARLLKEAAKLCAEDIMESRAADTAAAAKSAS